MPLFASELSTSDDFKSWDTFVISHPQGSFAQLSGWGNLKQQFEWQSHIIVVRDNNKIIAGALMMDKVGLAGKKISYVPYGPLIDIENQAATQMLLDELTRESSQSVVLRLESNVPHGHNQALKLQSILHNYKFVPSNRYLQPEATLFLDLKKSESELQAGMRQTTRRYIRQAERAELKVEFDTTGERLTDFYAILQQVNQRRQFGVHTLAYYQAVWDKICQDKSQSSSHPVIQPYLIFVQKGLEVLGSYFVIRAGNKSWELYGGVNEAGMKLKANYLLKWHSMLQMKQDGVTIYDQWGVAPIVKTKDSDAETQYDKQHHLSGVTYFKEGFGGDRVAYMGSYDKVNQLLFYKVARLTKKL